nr:protein chromatin remodeling 4 [Tanacetum cinerariifolium]
MLVALADHTDIAVLRGYSNLIDRLFPCRLLQEKIQALLDSCMILSSARGLDRLIVDLQLYLSQTPKVRVFLNLGQCALAPLLCRLASSLVERLLKAVIFVLSLLDNVRQPILIIAATHALSEWEAEFSKWSRFTNVVTYKGSEYVRDAIRNLEFYDENESITFQVLLSSPDVIVEDMEMLDHIKWDLIVIDECQRAITWSHINKIRKLDAHMKLLTISDKAVDTRQSYQYIISLLEFKYKAGHMKRTIDTETLKSKLSPFVAFECKISTPEFNEHWIPVHLSSMQIKQYCSILDSNFQILSSCFRDNSSLQDIIIETQKCCDHPYLVDPNLRNLSEEDASIDSSDVDVNVSGKLQLLNKFLSEIKQCGFRVVVLFQSVDNLEKLCIGDILDDLVDRRFGQDSYIRIGKICTNSDRQKKKQSLEMFNDVETRKFICLLEYRACHSSVRLSRMNVAILFNGDWNSSNDIRALQKITIESHSQQLKVFRLYSPFTVEEKLLIILKEGVTMETNVTASICHKLLAWGASYLLSKVGSENVSSSFIYDVVHELSSVLRNTCSKTDHTKVQDSPRNMCYLFEGYKPECKEKDMNATIFPSARKKARSKRKRRARIRGYQSSETSHTPHLGDIQRDALLFNITPTQPAPHVPVASGSRTNTEIEKIRKEREQVTKLHEEKKLMLIDDALNLHGPDKARLLTTRFSGQNIGMRGLRAPAPHLRSPSLFASAYNLPAAREPFLEPFPTLSILETLPYIQTAPNTGVHVHQVDLKKNS